jgi:hypothetical protein
MSNSDLHPDVRTLIARMTGPPPSHPHFVGASIDLTQIDALGLGDLWTVAQTVECWNGKERIESLAVDTAYAVFNHCISAEPAFRGAACRDCLDYFSHEVETAPKNAEGRSERDCWSQALFLLSRCIDLSFAGLEIAVGRFLAASNWRAMPHLAIALMHFAELPAETPAFEDLVGAFADTPFLLEEARVVGRLDLRASVEIAQVIYPRLGSDEKPDPTHHPLSDHPTYAAFAEASLKQAAAHVRKIHERTLPYESDKAFPYRDSAVIRRLMCVALDRDEAWLPPVLDELFRKVTLAPNAAKTVPSQSVGINLGHAIEAFPTPEAIATLRVVMRDIRHAGVKKKLERNLRGAERGLAARPEVALRLPPDQPVSKTQMTTLTRCLEGGLALGLTLHYDEWDARLASHAQAQALTKTLLWTIVDTTGRRTTVLPTVEGRKLTLRDVVGAPATVDSTCRMTLWHPAEATAEERDAWRERLASLQLKQPFKQVFREHYAASDEERSGPKTAMFADHVVSLIPFLGLARRERWRLDYECLVRSFGRWTARLDLAHRIYPGYSGTVATQDLHVSTFDGKTSSAALLGDVPRAVLSEILRAADLLVSTSGFALAKDEDDRQRDRRLYDLAQRPLGAMAEMRKRALARALEGREGMEDLRFDAHHLRLGRYAIHLATGRIVCDGEPITIDLPKRSNLKAVPWLPYDELLLETIVYAAVQIAGRLRG